MDYEALIDTWIDASFKERVLRAREQPPKDKLLDGLRLFDRACRTMADGIRHQFPQVSQEQVRKILVDRLERLRQLEESL
jgi:hypothetical protein